MRKEVVYVEEHICLGRDCWINHTAGLGRAVYLGKLGVSCHGSLGDQSEHGASLLCSLRKTPLDISVLEGPVSGCAGIPSAGRVLGKAWLVETRLGTYC